MTDPWLPASLAAQPVGHEVCVTFVTVGELARWAEKRHLRIIGPSER